MEPTCGWSGVGVTLQGLCSRELVIPVRGAGGEAEMEAPFGRLTDKVFNNVISKKNSKWRYFASFVGLARLKSRTTKVGSYMIVHNDPTYKVMYDPIRG